MCYFLENLKFNDETVKAKGGYAENEYEYDDELDRMFVKIVIGLTVREFATDNCAYE